MDNRQEDKERDVSRTLMGWDEGTEDRSINRDFINPVSKERAMEIEAENLRFREEQQERLTKYFEEKYGVEKVSIEDIQDDDTVRIVQSLVPAEFVLVPKLGQVTPVEAGVTGLRGLRADSFVIDDGIREELRRQAESGQLIPRNDDYVEPLPEELDKVMKKVFGLREIEKPKVFSGIFPAKVEVKPEVPVKVKVRVNLFTKDGKVSLAKGQVYEVIKFWPQGDNRAQWKVMDELGRYVTVEADDAVEFFGEAWLEDH